MTNGMTKHSAFVGWDMGPAFRRIDAVTHRLFSGAATSASAAQAAAPPGLYRLCLDSEGNEINSGNTCPGRVNIDTKYKYFSAVSMLLLSRRKNNNFSQSTTGCVEPPLTRRSLHSSRFTSTMKTRFHITAFQATTLWLSMTKTRATSMVTNQTINANPWLPRDLPFGIWAKTNLGGNLVDQTDYDYWSAVYNPQNC